MHDALTFFLTGATLGLAGALSPGPLQTLVCAQTLVHGPREGARVAMAPLFTDLPVMIGCLTALEALARFNWLMGLISLAGGLVVLRFGWGSLTSGPLKLSAENAPARSWRKGVATNFLNPNMWIFWSTVGGPTLMAAINSSTLTAAGFLGGFYVSLIGTFAALAFASARFSRLLSGPGYVWTMRALGVLLIGLAARLFFDGLTRLNVI